MNLLNISQHTKDANIMISLNELIILNNALNEVCNGLDICEFETRMGCSMKTVVELLKNVGNAIEQVTLAETP